MREHTVIVVHSGQIQPNYLVILAYQFRLLILHRNNMLRIWGVKSASLFKFCDFSSVAFRP